MMAKELATFAKYGDVESMRFAPLWLAPWLLSSVLLDLASTSLLEVLEILIPNWTSFFMKPLNGFFAEVFHVEEGSRLAGFLAALAIWCLSGLCYLPASIPGCVAFQRKLCNHKLMLEQMSSFDIREAKCSVASDRQLVEDQAPGIDIDQQGFQEFTHIHTYIYIYGTPPMDPGLVRLTCIFQCFMLIFASWICVKIGGRVIHVYDTHACIQM